MDPGRAGEREVCAIVLARLGPKASGQAEATVLIELDSGGSVIDDSVYLAPREAMDSWPLAAPNRGRRCRSVRPRANDELGTT